MSKIDELLAQQKALAEKLEVAMKEERVKVKQEIKEKIKLFGFKTTDFKGVLKTRKPRKSTTRPIAKKPTKRA